MQYDVFRDDPFLLKNDSQEQYGEILLRNVLIGRTTLTCRTAVVDLHAGSEGQGRGEDDLPTGAELAELAPRYLRNRILRNEIENSDQEKLMRVSLMSRPERTARRVHSVKDKQGVQREKFPTDDAVISEMASPQSKLGYRLRIATIGFRVKVSKQKGEALLNEDLCVLRPLPYPPYSIRKMPDRAGINQLGRTTLAPGAKIVRWEATIAGHIKKALATGSQIIVVPELGLPPESGGIDPVRKISACSAAVAGKEMHDHFIFAGSRHDGGYNRGLLLHLKNQKPHDDDPWHYKVASARSLGENILGPESDVFPSYQVDIKIGGRETPFHITVAICYDTFDPSTFLSLVLHSAWREGFQKEQIILVPSFNPSDEFVEMLRDLSFLTSSTVVYVNSLHGDADMFICGFRISDLVDQPSTVTFEQIDEQDNKLTEMLRTQQEAMKVAQDEMKPLETDEARTHGDWLRKRKNALSVLRNGIAALEGSGGLRHLITIERCEGCAKLWDPAREATEELFHEDDYDCPSDILYYNLDIRLLDVLQQFRKQYFKLDEAFLPAPYRQESLEKAARELLKRQFGRRRSRRTTRTSAGRR